MFLICAQREMRFCILLLFICDKNTGSGQTPGVITGSVHFSLLKPGFSKVTSRLIRPSNTVTVLVTQYFLRIMSLYWSSARLTKIYSLRTFLFLVLRHSKNTKCTMKKSMSSAAFGNRYSVPLSNAALDIILNLGDNLFIVVI